MSRFILQRPWKLSSILTLEFWHFYGYISEKTLIKLASSWSFIHEFIYIRYSFARVSCLNYFSVFSFDNLHMSYDIFYDNSANSWILIVKNVKLVWLWNTYQLFRSYVNPKSLANPQKFILVRTWYKMKNNNRSTFYCSNLHFRSTKYSYFSKS